MRNATSSQCIIMDKCIKISGPNPGFLDRGFKLAEGGSICAV